MAGEVTAHAETAMSRKRGALTGEAWGKEPRPTHTPF